MCVYSRLCVWEMAELPQVENIKLSPSHTLELGGKVSAGLAAVCCQTFPTAQCVATLPAQEPHPPAFHNLQPSPHCPGLHWRLPPNALGRGKNREWEAFRLTDVHRATLHKCKT